MTVLCRGIDHTWFTGQKTVAGAPYPGYQKRRERCDLMKMPMNSSQPRSVLLHLEQKTEASPD